MSSSALPLLTEDETLGRYELLSPIGRGRMATVWAARLRGSHGFSKFVAVKTMLPVLSSDPRFAKMFLAEVQIAATIDHPNVCEILDLGKERGVVYLVMNWVDGESLAGLLSTCTAAGRSIPPAVAARIIAQAARGLHAAHVLQTEGGELRPVIHRDVSPKNILVTCAGQVTVVDFGVARAAERSEPTTEAGFIKGRVAYLAPEQIEGRDIDVRVDVFALGVVLYELVSGKHPFVAETDLATLLGIAAPDPAPPIADVGCPAALRAIVGRALEKDLAKRYGSMRELATALETFAAGVEKGRDDVSTFVTEMLGAQRTERAKELREAVRSVDLRREQHEAVTNRSVSARPPAADSRGRAVERSGMPPPVRRRVLLFVAIGVVGLGLGAMGLRASHSPPASQPPVPSASASSPPPAASSGSR